MYGPRVRAICRGVGGSRAGSLRDPVRAKLSDKAIPRETCRILRIRPVLSDISRDPGNPANLRGTCGMERTAGTGKIRPMRARCPVPVGRYKYRSCI